MPATADYISVTLNNEAHNILAKTRTPTMTGTGTRSFAVSAAYTGARNKKISLLIGNTTSDVKLTLQAFDAAGTKLAEKAMTTRVNKTSAPRYRVRYLALPLLILPCLLTRYGTHRAL